MKTGDRIAMLGLNSDRFWEYVVAVPWGGGVINPCNLRWSAVEIRYSLTDSGSQILIVDDNFKHLAAELSGDDSPVKVLIHAGDGPAPEGMLSFERLIADTDPVSDAGRMGNDLFGIFYTGGTTGAPKGVMLSHLNFMVSALASTTEDMFTRPGNCLHVAPMFHLADLSLGCSHWILGNTHCVIPAFSPEAVIDAIENERVTEMVLVPTMVQMLVDHPAMHEGRDLSSLKHIIYGGSAIAEAVIERALAAIPSTRFVQAYGMTELSPLATILPAFYHTVEGRKLGKMGATGRAGACVEIRIVDPDGHMLPSGEKGEIIVRGPNVMLGYWNKPEQTAEVIREGWMHTGDAGYLDDEGFLYVVDRIKDMIVSGGENVYSAEVENALAQHPAVQSSAVIGIPSAKWGESVHAFVIFKPNVTATGEDLFAHCKQLIAGYKCPRSFDFVIELPLSGPGKVLKTELRKKYWEGRDRLVS